VTPEVWYPVLPDVLAMHDRMLRYMDQSPPPLMEGGREKLESAIARPIWAAQYANADLAEQAALLAIGIAQAHAFVDTNKRLGYITAVVFLRENGHPLPPDNALRLAHRMIEVLEHTSTVADLVVWLRDVIATHCGVPGP
jgi:death-on-curing protein